MEEFAETSSNQQASSPRSPRVKPEADHPQRPYSVYDDGRVRTNVYVKGLSPGIDDAALELMCQAYGPIVSCKVMVDVHTNSSKGVGFVNFTSREDALRCIMGLQAQSLDASLAKLSVAQRIAQLQDESNANVYISKLPSSTTANELAQIFANFNVRSTKVLTDPATGARRGVGFVLFGSHDEAKQAISDASKGLIKTTTGETLTLRFADTMKQKHLKRHVRREREKHALGLLEKKLPVQSTDNQRFYGVPYFGNEMLPVNATLPAPNQAYYQQQKLVNHPHIALGYIDHHQLSKLPETNMHEHHPIWSPAQNFVAPATMAVNYTSSYMPISGYHLEQQYYQSGGSSSHLLKHS